MEENLYPYITIGCPQDYIDYPGCRYVVRTYWESGEIREKGLRKLRIKKGSFLFSADSLAGKLLFVEYWKRDRIHPDRFRLMWRKMK